MKGTGFSPYIKQRKISRALAPERQPLCRFLPDFRRARGSHSIRITSPHSYRLSPQGLKPPLLFSALTYGLKPVPFNVSNAIARAPVKIGKV